MFTYKVEIKCTNKSTKKKEFVRLTDFVYKTRKVYYYMHHKLVISARISSDIIIYFNRCGFSVMATKNG